MRATCVISTLWYTRLYLQVVAWWRWEREREKMLETFFIFRENSSKLFLKNNVYFSKNRLFGFTRVILMAHIISSSVPGVQSWNNLDNWWRPSWFHSARSGKMWISGVLYPFSFISFANTEPISWREGFKIFLNIRKQNPCHTGQWSLHLAYLCLYLYPYLFLYPFIYIYIDVCVCMCVCVCVCIYGLSS